MFKNEVKGHGTIKKLRTGAVVSVLALSVAGVGATVSADEVSPQYTGADVAGVTAVENPDYVAPTETKVTDEQVSTAKADANKANQAVTAQEGVVGHAEQAVATNDATVTNLNNQIQEVNAITPDVVDQAKADATTAGGSLATANEAVTSADASLTDASTKAETQEGVVSNAQAEADKTASAVAGAEKKVEGLSTATDTAKLEQDVDDLTTKVAEDTTNLQSAKDALDAAKLADTNKAQAIEDQKAVVADAEQAVDSIAKEYFSAIKASRGTQLAEDSAKSAFDEAKANYGSVSGNILKSHPEYAELLKQYWANPSQELSDKLKDMGRQIMEQDWSIPKDAILTVSTTENLFKSGTFSQEDSKRVVNPTNLSEADKLDLAKFVGTSLSEVRSGLGQAPLVVDEDVMKLSQRITDLTRPENFLGHDLDAMGKAFNEVAVRDSYQDETGTIYPRPPYALSENEAFPTYTGSLTMADLKRGILFQLVSIVYADDHSKWGHTKNAVYGDTSFGVAFNEKFDGFQNVIEFRFNTLSDTSRKFTDFSGKQYPVENPSVALKAKVDAAQQAYDQAVKANQDAKANVASKETAYKEAQSKLATAQQQLADLQNGKADIPALEQAVKDAEIQLGKDQASLQTAKETLALAKASAADRVKALETAKSELADAKIANEKAQGVLAKEKETLEVLTKAKEVAGMALTDAKSKQALAQKVFDTASAKASDLATKLANKETVLADLKAKLADASAKASVLRAELETAKELLATLKADANTKQVEYLRILGLKAEQDKAEAEAQRLQALKDKADAIIKAGGQVVQVVDKDGNLVDVVDGKAKGTAPVTPTKFTKQAGVTQVGNKVTYSRVERAKALPDTGSQESLLGLLGASMLLGLGFVGKRRKA